MWIISGTLIGVALFLLTGCGSILGGGSDGSRVVVENDCEVSLSQAAKTEGFEANKVVEVIKVNPDCTVEVDFRMEEGLGLPEAPAEEGVLADP